MGTVTEPLADGLDRVRGLLLDGEALVRAVASGRQRGQQPRWRRVEARWVDLKAGPATATVWTNDLTYDYVRENAEYST